MPVRETIAEQATTSAFVEDFMVRCEATSPHEPEFLQAVREVMISLDVVMDRHPEYRHARILERMVEPERVVQFRVAWTDDDETVHVNRGFRVFFNSAIGPYKGGLRFHPSVNLSILKFLGFEQIFKNSLTSLPLGGAKGGSDFDPHGRSDGEVMRFCQSFMSELFRHIGHNTDVPAGDIGVGEREIGYLFGAYKKLANVYTDVFTGRGEEWGGSLLRPEATGYGCVYFACEMLADAGKTIEDMTCLVSGSGNVAQYCVEKINEMGGRTITLSDSSGWIHDPEGISPERLEWVKALKNERRGRIREYADAFTSASYHEHAPDADHNPMWCLEAEGAFPCATENEIRATDARNLIAGGVRFLSEGANMPTDTGAQAILLDDGILYGPGKAANAGGVAVSALEMAQARQFERWERDTVDRRLREIMHSIHDTCLATAEAYGSPGNYTHGANITGFLKVADAMLAQGVV